jgi:hypothetical protein
MGMIKPENRFLRQNLQTKLPTVGGFFDEAY